jgi:endonuclease/exonuclease/phosphatase family metal-dependent hydrolase
MSYWECFKTKFPVDWREINHLPSTDRYYISEYITINGKVVYLINVHLTPGTSAEHAQKRIGEANDILDILADKEYFIMFGDFNPEPGEEDSLFKIFSDAGYNLANCGWFGKYYTWSTTRSDLDTDDPPQGTVYYIDNIITSSNITIENVERLTVFSKLSSDHIPIKARLRID